MWYIYTRVTKLRVHMPHYLLDMLGVKILSVTSKHFMTASGCIHDRDAYYVLY